MPHTSAWAISGAGATLRSIPAAYPQDAKPAWSHALTQAPPGVSLRGSRGRYLGSVFVPVSAQKAWTLLTNYSQLPSVVPDIKRVRVLSRQGNRVEVEQVYQAPYTFGLPIQARLLFEEQAPRSLSYSLLQADQIRRLQGSWTVLPAQGGVVLQHRIELEPNLPAALLPSYYALNETSLRQALESLRRALLRG